MKRPDPPPLQILNGQAAKAGYRVGSRQARSGTRRLKYYIAFDKKRVSPYFQSPTAAAKWLRATAFQRA